MLVFSRKVGEKFVIGDSIEITILSIQGGNRIRVGIEAPKDIRVMRSELPIKDTQVKEVIKSEEVKEEVHENTKI